MFGFGRTVAGDAERLPPVVREMFCQHDYLPNVEGVVRYLPIDGLHHGVRFAADSYRAAQIGIRERLQRLKYQLPTVFP